MLERSGGMLLQLGAKLTIVFWARFLILGFIMLRTGGVSEQKGPMTHTRQHCKTGYGGRLENYS